MTVGELRELIDYENKPKGTTNDEFDEMLVMIPVTMDIDGEDGGEFITPSTMESGVDELEMEHNILESELALLLVPNGFYSEEVNPQLN